MKIEIDKFDINDHVFTKSNREYRIIDLINLSKDLEIIEIPLIALDLDKNPWNDSMNIREFIYHVQRVNDSSLDFPIILDPDGTIADGWHRICKAIIENKSIIKAVRLKEMPHLFVKYD